MKLVVFLVIFSPLFTGNIAEIDGH